MPLETISGNGRTSRPVAGTTEASFGRALTWARIAAAFFPVSFAVESAVERGGNAGGKIKGRLVAADEKTGEADIIHTQFQGTVGVLAPDESNFIFAFYSPTWEYRATEGILSRRAGA